MRIRKGDTVKIISGKDRGKTGTVIKVFPKEERILVGGINVYKKRVRPKRQGEKGETVLVPRPLSASKVMLVCKNCKRAARLGFRREGGRKVRYCKKCQSAV
jgi:large subunit ribosomal protein L24